MRSWLEGYERGREELLEKLRKCKEKVEVVRDYLFQQESLKRLSPQHIQDPMVFVDGGQGLVELLGTVIYSLRASCLFRDSKSSEFLRRSEVGFLEHTEMTAEKVELLLSILELRTALEALERYKPALLFLDGSLQALFHDPKKRLLEGFSTQRKLLVKLLKASHQLGTSLVGVSEDSKARLLVRKLSAELGLSFPPMVTDISLLKALMPARSYLCVQGNPTFGLVDFALSFKTVYLQPSSASIPLRIDVPSWCDEGLIASVVLGLCQASGSYGYPLPLYLAHLDARVKRREAEWNAVRLINDLGGEDVFYSTFFRRTRRSMRPIG